MSDLIKALSTGNLSEQSDHSSEFLDHAPGRMLVVDDIADNRELLSRRFAKEGFEIVEADSGERALEALAKYQFDIVLLDIRMPGIDGIETLKIIRQSFSITQLPVIMVTANAETGSIVQALNLSANDYITKPIIFSVVRARVNAQLARKRADEHAAKAITKVQETADQMRRMANTFAELNEKLLGEISLRQHTEELARFHADHDPLTELPNRRKFEHDLAEISSNNNTKNFIILFVDLDGFKTVNDTIGHFAGDLLLQKISNEFKKVISSDDRIARVGGDEFAILRTGTSDAAEAGILARALIDAASREYEILGRLVTIGACIGISLSPDCDSMDPVVAADIAMYKAKSEGKNNYKIFQSRYGREIIEKQLLIKDLQDALARREFVVHYQPFVCSATNGVTGYEVLLRWQHPTRGLMPPDLFIPLLEETSLINPVGAWVVEQVCNDATCLPDQARISVNVSPAQLRDRKFPDYVSKHLQDSNIAPERLEIEITESVLISDAETALENMQRLRALGVTIALDDFGIGFSSLSYLRKFPFQRIKIDKSFVQNLAMEWSTQIIVKSTCDMARALNMTITAEGIETAEQERLLKLMGVHEMQGYLYGRPKPLKDILSSGQTVRTVA